MPWTNRWVIEPNHKQTYPAPSGTLKRYPPFVLELRHGGVDPWESGPGLLPRQKFVLIFVPRYLPVPHRRTHGTALKYCHEYRIYLRFVSRKLNALSLSRGKPYGTQ